MIKPMVHTFVLLLPGRGLEMNWFQAMGQYFSEYLHSFYTRLSPGTFSSFYFSLLVWTVALVLELMAASRSTNLFLGSLACLEKRVMSFSGHTQISVDNMQIN